MKYRNIYSSVDAVKYTGKNFKEVNDFCGKIAWGSKEMSWSDDNPPDDLKVIFNQGSVIQLLKAGDYIVRLSTDNYMVFDKKTFEVFFEEV